MHGRSATRFYQMPWLLEGRRNRKWKGQELSADQKLPKLTMHSLLFHRVSQSLAYIHTIQYPLQSAVTLHASLQNFSLFGPNISISRPASSTTSDKKKERKKGRKQDLFYKAMGTVCQSSRSTALRQSICILGGTAAWQGRGVFDVLWDPRDVQDAARTFGKHSTATDFKLPERFKAWKE